MPFLAAGCSSRIQRPAKLAPPPGVPVLVEATHPDLADALTVHPICQEALSE